MQICAAIVVRIVTEIPFHLSLDGALCDWGGGVHTELYSVTSDAFQHNFSSTGNNNNLTIILSVSVINLFSTRKLRHKNAIGARLKSEMLILTLPMTLDLLNLKSGGFGPV